MPEHPPIPVGPSFATSGHSIYKFKGVYSVNPRPPHITSQTWATFGPPGRIAELNKYRKSRGLRTSNILSEVMTFLMEEHAPHLLGSDHVMPDGGTAGDAPMPVGKPDGQIWTMRKVQGPLALCSCPQCSLQVQDDGFCQFCKEDTRTTDDPGIGETGGGL